MTVRSPTLALALAAVLAGCGGPHALTSYHVLPAPRALEPGSGSFELNASTSVVVADGDDGELMRLGEFWAGPVRAATGFALPVAAAGGEDGGTIRLSLGGEGPEESYNLSVSGDGVDLSAPGHAGIFYGLQTLTQMLPPEVAAGGGPAGGAVAEDGGGGPAGEGADRAGRPAGTGPPLEIPEAEIHDAPRFPYRGMHLDVARHFFGPDFVKRYIDLLARYKINRFHWHLTEDQGWRIEIERYPRLTEVGAWRDETHEGHGREDFQGDGTPHGGFYTKEEIRDIVAYAADRYVTVIPEIEMPGHSTAALAAYPELACTEGPFEVARTWGVFEDIYCPKEETFEFLQNVLLEVMELFPSEYIHIGGDEAPKARWEESPVARAVMEREGLADTDELQSWFIRRIERFLNSHGRRLIGWDEILEGGLAPDATVMSWRGTEGGIEAAKEGHDVIMTPTSHLYFDYYQGDPESEPLAIGGFLPLERVYAFEPVPDELTDTEAGHVLGAQGNVWTEYMKTPKHVEYMVFPRLFALSEIVWAPEDVRNLEDFQRRLPWHLEYLDALGVGYRIPDVGGLEEDRLTLEDEVELSLAAPARGTIRYTVDGTEPDASSPAYAGPLDLDLEDGPVTVAARIVTEDGREGAARRATFARATLRPAAMVDTATLEPGLTVEMVEGSFRNVARMEREVVVRREDVDDVGLPPWVPAEEFGLRFGGYLSVPADGVYELRLTSDDGSVLRLGGRVIVDHDGLHGASTAEGQVALAAGVHPLQLHYFQAGGGQALSLEVGRVEGEDEGDVRLLRVR